MRGRLRDCGLLVCVPLLAVWVGCGEKGALVSGNVTFKGQPVPEGKVYIVPDSGAGNQGAAGYANIKNGVYDTAAEGGRPATPGAVVLKVEGYDPNPPPNAGPDVTTTRLFAGYEKKAEISGGKTVQDIEVPAEAAKGLKSLPESGVGSGKINP